MTLNKTSTAWLLSLGAALGACWALGACAPDTQTRQGAPGELCFTDADCRQPLICEQNLCVQSGAAQDDTGDNNEAPVNNSQEPEETPQGEVNCDLDDPDCVCLDGEGFFCEPYAEGCSCDTHEGRLTCVDICDHLINGCGIVEDDCPALCQDFVTDQPEDQQQETLRCIQETPCDDIYSDIVLCLGG
jgi:hypothetical protein